MCFFFFKQKRAYEMRISDWSSDVCSSDLAAGIPQIRGAAEEVMRLEPDLVLGGTFTRRETRGLLRRMGYRVVDVPAAESFAAVRTTTRELAALRTEERRVGEEWVSTCITREAPCH